MGSPHLGGIVPDPHRAFAVIWWGLEQLSALPGDGDDASLVGGLRRRIEVLEREAAQVTQWLHATTGLVEPEPAGQPAAAGRIDGAGCGLATPPYPLATS